MPYYEEIASSAISDEEAEIIKGYGRTFKTFNIVGQNLSHSREFSVNDIAVLLSETQNGQMPLRRGMYPIPKAYFDLEQL